LLILGARAVAGVRADEVPANGTINGWTRRTLPDVVRIRVDFPPGDRRVWPELLCVRASCRCRLCI